MDEYKGEPMGWGRGQEKKNKKIQKKFKKNSKIHLQSEKLAL